MVLFFNSNLESIVRGEKMREKWIRCVSLFLVGVLCCSIFAGCSSQVSEAVNQGPEEISQGKVSQESVSIVQGENH